MVRSRLLVGCALAVLASGLRPAAANAQAFAGTPTTQFGSITYNRATPGVETLVQDTPSAVIDWVPTDTTTGPGPIDFLPGGTTATFIGAAGPNFTVLNRILPSGTAVGRSIGFNGTVESGFIDASSNFVTGGSVWFYSPGGILVGSTGVFDVGSLVLTANDVAVDGNGFFIDPSGNSVFTAAPDSRAAVLISPGAQINALVPGSYVALIAPRLIQSGTVNVDGAAAYVAAEATTINVNAGLFDITLTTGSAVDPTVAGDGVTFRHNGVTNLGSGGGQHIYMAVLPKNEAVTMLVSGTVGYDPASVATAVGDTVVLSAGADIVGGTIATSFNTATPASIDLGTGVYGPAVTARAVDGVTVSGTMAFGADVDLFGGNLARLNAKSGETITIGGNLILASQSADTGGTLRGGTAELVVDAGGAITIGGSAIIDAGAYLLPLDGRPFPPSLSGFGDGPNAIGGTARIQANTATISVGGTTFIGADAGGGDGGFGANGGTASAGSASLSLIGTRFTGGGDIGVVARGLGGIGVAAGNGTGGTASLSSNGSAIIGNGVVKISATGTGGGAFDGGAAGVGRGGQATTVVNDLDPAAGPTPGGLTITGFTIEANGVGGTYYCGFFCTPSNGAPGGDGFGGVARLSQDAGIIRAGDISISADGSGGNGVADQSGGNGGNGGSGFGGASEMILTGGTITPAVSSLSITLSVIGNGGNGGDATAALISGPSGDGGRGGNATGGQARADIQTVLSADDISLTSSAFSGGGGSSDDGSGGNGGDALSPVGFNRTELIVSGSGNLAMPNGSVELASRSFGSGGGGSGLAGYFATGGAATGGTAIFTNSSTIDVSSLAVVSSGRGGDGGFNTLASESGGGSNGVGGTSRFDMLGGAATIGSMFVRAFGIAGISGNGTIPGISRGGLAQVALAGGVTTIADQFEIEASGSGFDNEIPSTGDAFGGSATFLAQNGAVFNFAGAGMLISADGVSFDDDPGPIRTGRGGNASFGVDNAAISIAGGVTVSASGVTPDVAAGASNAIGGTANIFAINGGSLSLSGSVSVLAEGQSGIAATNGTGTGGTASLLAQGADVNLDGATTISADGGGYNALGGTVSLNGTFTAASSDIRAVGRNRAGGTGIGGLITASSPGVLAIDGSVLGRSIVLTSSDIDISVLSIIGDAGTDNISLFNGGTGLTVIGGAGTGTGWQLSNAEFGRLQAHDISISGSGDISVGQLDIIGSLGADSGAQRRNLTGSTLSISSADALTVDGAVSLVDSAPTDMINLSATGRIDVITPSGSIAITGAGGAISGELSMAAPTIFIGSPTAAQAIDGLSSATLISTRLATNDGPVNNQGYVQADRISFGIADGLYIQNSGGDQSPDDRAGFTAGDGGVSIRLDQPGSAIIAINGRIAGAQTTTTGTGLIPLLAITDADFIPSAAFDQRSTANGCLIANGVCAAPTEIVDAVPPAQDIIGIITDEGTEGLGTVQTLAMPLIELPNFNPLDFAPLIDEPVTGTGNEDLWISGPGGL